MSDEYLMALDAGTGAGRCFLISTDGKKAYSAYQEWLYDYPEEAGGMGVQFNPDVFWGIMAGTVRQAMQKAGIKGEQVVGVSSTSQREGCVFLDENGKELYAGPNRDFRAAVEGMQLASQFGSEIYQRSGHYPNGIFAPARLMWLKKHAPEKYERIAHLQMINDWILYRLSGQIACEPSNASETCVYDLIEKDWMADTIEALELPLQIFPQILDSGTQLGTLSQKAASETGLQAGTPVVIGGADTQCGLLGSGLLHDAEICAVSGTSTPVQMVTDKPYIDPDLRLWAGAYLLPGMFILESNAGGTGSTYQWYRDTFCQSEVEKVKGTNKSAYEILNEGALQAPPGSLGVQSFIGISVFNARNISMPTNQIHLGMAPFQFTGGSKPLITRAIMESLAYAVKANTDQITNLIGKQPESMAICGGLANSDLYLEILANVLQIPLSVPVWKEATASGAAICAGVGSGVFQSFDEGVKVLAQTEKTIHPEESHSKQYRGLYRKWFKTYQSLAA